MASTLRGRLKEAEEHANRLTRELAELQRVTERKLQAKDEEIKDERIGRVSAQRGLVPYVRSLETFDHWLRERPALRHELEPILRELGLWQIKLAYDPDRDIELTVLSPRRK